MKIVSLIVCFCFSFNVLASSGTIQELEKQLDEYQYALTVEWDQKDEAFYQQETTKFFQNLGKLQQEGLTKEEILSVIEKKSINRPEMEAVKLRLNLLVPNASTTEQLGEILKDNAKNTYLRGASWNGEVLLWVGGGLVLTALIGYAIWFHNKYKCVSEERYRDCDWETDSNGDRDYECEYKTRCTEWVERE